MWYWYRDGERDKWRLLWGHRLADTCGTLTHDRAGIQNNRVTDCSANGNGKTHYSHGKDKVQNQFLGINTVNKRGNALTILEPNKG